MRSFVKTFERLQEENSKDNYMTNYIILGIVAVVIIAVHYFKVIRRKEDFLDEDEEKEYNEE